VVVTVHADCLIGSSELKTCQILDSWITKTGASYDSRFQRLVKKLYLLFGFSAEASAGLNEASLFIKRPLRRAAAFLWITPFSAALSSALMALRTSSLVSGVLFAKEARAWLTAVRDAPRTLRLLIRRFSFCLFRLICDCMLAKVLLAFLYCFTARANFT
jgi:hypothetical protein